MLQIVTIKISGLKISYENTNYLLERLIYPFLLISTNSL
jgi:hypothetical protein